MDPSIDNLLKEFTAKTTTIAEHDAPAGLTQYLALIGKEARP
jgi:hypothetical protein